MDICLCMLAYKYLCMCAFICVWACMCICGCSECGLPNVICGEHCILSPPMTRKRIKPLISWEPHIYKTVYKMIVAVKNISWSEMEHKENQGVHFIWDQAAIRDVVAREVSFRLWKLNNNLKKRQIINLANTGTVFLRANELASVKVLGREGTGCSEEKNGD